MPDPKQCQRCHQTIDGNRTVLLVDTGDPEAKVQELTVCGRCLESYRRWAARRSRSRTSASSSPKAAAPPKNESGRKHKREQPLTATEARERHAARMRIRLIGVTASIALAGYALLSLLAYVLFSGK